MGAAWLGAVPCVAWRRNNNKHSGRGGAVGKELLGLRFDMDTMEQVKGHIENEFQ